MALPVRAMGIGWEALSLCGKPLEAKRSLRLMNQSTQDAVILCEETESPMNNKHLRSAGFLVVVIYNTGLGPREVRFSAKFAKKMWCRESKMALAPFG
jgi:hypothetical protein